jgi:hypothetical protein
MFVGEAKDKISAFHYVPPLHSKYFSRHYNGSSIP